MPRNVPPNRKPDHLGVPWTTAPVDHLTPGKTT